MNSETYRVRWTETVECSAEISATSPADARRQIANLENSSIKKGKGHREMSSIEAFKISERTW